MSLAVVILAAGASSRMGRPKLLLPWGGTTVLGHLLAQWRQIGPAQIGAVCATGDAGLNDELDRLGFPHSQRIVNPDPARGMFSSIQCAAHWPGWESSRTHWVITLGDQPHLKLETLRSLTDFAALHPDCVCQPASGGRPRHPVVLPRNTFQKLGTATCTTLKDFLDTDQTVKRSIDLPDGGLELDLDTLADYEEAKRTFDR